MRSVATVLMFAIPSLLLAADAPSQVPATTALLPDSAVFQVIQLDRYDFESTGISMAADAALLPDGGLIVADAQTGELTRLSERGDVVWRTGGKGDGPGEFHFLYKVTVDAAGDIHAFDLGGSRVSVFSDDGTFQDRVQLDIAFRQVDDVKVLDEGDYLLVGVASLPSAFLRHAIHRFHSSGEYASSFGPLPAADSAEVLNFWGAGGLALDPDGRVLFGRRLPYDFFVYTSDGRLLSSWQADVEVVGKPDDAYVIERENDRFRISYSERPVDWPLPPFFVWGGDILSGRFQKEKRRWDVFDSRGELESSFDVPNEWGGIIAVDTLRSAIWLVERSDYSTAVLRAVVDRNPN